MAYDVQRLPTFLDILNGSEHELSRRQDRHVARPQVLLRAVLDRTRAFSRTQILGLEHHAHPAVTIDEHRGPILLVS